MILTAATRNESGSSKTSGGNIMHETLTVWAPRALSVLRIYTGLLLLAHGTAKILGFPAVPSFANVEINSLTGASGLIELTCFLLRRSRAKPEQSCCSFRAIPNMFRWVR